MILDDKLRGLERKNTSHAQSTDTQVEIHVHIQIQVQVQTRTSTDTQGDPERRGTWKLEPEELFFQVRDGNKTHIALHEASCLIHHHSLPPHPHFQHHHHRHHRHQLYNQYLYLHSHHQQK